MRLLLIGCGKMGGAMAERWKMLDAVKQLIIVDPHTSDITSAANIPSEFTPDVIVLAVKPQNLEETLKDYTQYKDAVFLSIVAGKDISFFQKQLGENTKIVRSMPNLPASIGEGMTGAYATPNLSSREREWGETLLAATGKMLWVEEEALLDPVTAVSGSGPAYFFLMVETLAKAGEKLGLNADQAEMLARQTLIGSAALVKAVDTPASELRENVTSKKGTTDAALKVLMADPGIQKLFDNALEAAVTRAKELAK